MAIDQLAALFDTHKIMWVVGILAIINLSMTIFEVALDVFTSKKRRWQDTGANCVIFIAYQVLQNSIFGAVGFFALLPFYLLTPVHIPMSVWTWCIAIIAADFSYYWMHRFEHQHRILWASHSVHHSSQDFNLTVAFRLSVFEHFYTWLFLVPMVLIGFSPFQTLVSLILVAQYQHWIHTERIHKLGVMDEIFNTPSVHRVHHASNNPYLDKNYGGLLIIWDKMFGTFAREEKRVIYGLTRNINTNNPIKITGAEFFHLHKDLKQCRTVRDKARLIFGSLAWRPHYFSKNVNKENAS